MAPVSPPCSGGSDGTRRALAPPILLPVLPVLVLLATNSNSAAYINTSGSYMELATAASGNIAAYSNAIVGRSPSSR